MRVGNDLIGGDSPASKMTGNGGLDVLIGAGNDLLIGGYTDFDSTPNALAVVLAEWTSEALYDQRVAHLTPIRIA